MLIGSRNIKHKQHPKELDNAVLEFYIWAQTVKFYLTFIWFFFNLNLNV